jgi:small subunit ribosomal protein S17
VENNVSQARVLIGTVVSDKMQDTIVVKIERKVRHPKYEKAVRRSTKLHVHDKGNTAKIGDLVSVKEIPPMSKTKFWTLLEIVQRNAEQVK